MKELIEQIEANEELEDWLENYGEILNSFCYYHYTTYYDLMPDSSKLAIIAEWLREDKKIIVQSIPVDGWDVWSFRVLQEDIMSPFFEAVICKKQYKTHNEALAEGIKEAIKLIV